MKKVLLLLSILIVSFSCNKQNSNKDYEKKVSNAEFLIDAELMLTKSIIHDIFSPPVSSRIYYYSSLAAYEVAIQGDPAFASMAGQINGFEGIEKPQPNTEISYPVASTWAFLSVGKSMTFAEELYTEYEKQLDEKYLATGIPEDVYENSKEYGLQVAGAIKKYFGKDNYKETRGFRYTVTNEKGTWIPTPPGYFDAVEPFWPKIRPAVLDSAAQFKQPDPVPFNPTKGSAYYKEMMEVYETVNNLTEEQRNIANFWDCNPFKMNITGHAMFATKKMSPGGHWMGIAGQVSRQLHKSYGETAEAFLLTSMSIFDGFISCWSEKYRTKRIRPETVINEYVDKDWLPLLQTPPFPEYTSGHSTISNSAAVVLTKIYGDNISFADSTEIPYGLPPRKFTSFFQAADEAGISRLYGGIHFRPACEVGKNQGQQVGKLIISKIKTRK